MVTALSRWLATTGAQPDSQTIDGYVYDQSELATLQKVEYEPVASKSPTDAGTPLRYQLSL